MCEMIELLDFQKGQFMEACLAGASKPLTA